MTQPDQTSSSPSTPASDELDRVLDSALRVAGANGWTKGSLAQVAEDTGLPYNRVLALLPTRTAVLEAWGARVDAQVLDEAVELDPEESVRDRLFDLIMRRLDALDPNRDALAALTPACLGDPLMGLTAAMGLSRSMAMTLEAAGVGAAGFAGMIRVKGLSALFLYVLREWMGDDSPDMAKTMASLDKALDKAESLAVSLFSRGGVDRGDSTGEGEEDSPSKG